MSVLENVALGAHLRGRQGHARDLLRLDRAEEARCSREARAPDRARAASARRSHEPAGSLPLGQQRVVEIARALAADPSLLLLDEPAAGLRHKEKQELADLLAQLRAEGMSILLVEHDMEFVMGLTDRLVVLEFGAEASPKARRARCSATRPCWRPTSAASRACEHARPHASRCA